MQQNNSNGFIEGNGVTNEIENNNNERGYQGGLLDYLMKDIQKKQPQIDMNQLYSDPWTCKSIFRL